MPIKVLLADDITIMRKAIRFLLRSRNEIKIVGEASTFVETIEKTKKLSPDVVVLDLYMPDRSSFTATELKAVFKDSRVVAISFWRSCVLPYRRRTKASTDCLLHNTRLLLRVAHLENSGYRSFATARICLDRSVRSLAANVLTLTCLAFALARTMPIIGGRITALTRPDAFWVVRRKLGGNGREYSPLSRRSSGPLSDWWRRLNCFAVLFSFFFLGIGFLHAK